MRSRSATCLAGLALAVAPSAAGAEDVDVYVPPLAPPDAPPVAVPELPTVPGAPSAAAAPAPAAPQQARAAGGCRGAGARAGAASPATLRSAVLCLISAARTARGRGAIGADGRLSAAARRHASDMARRGYFGHVSPSGRGPRARARAAGFDGGVAEVLAWGSGPLTSPRATVQAWLRSAPHRAILLDPSLRVAGAGVARAGRRATWVVDFG